MTTAKIFTALANWGSRLPVTALWACALVVPVWSADRVVGANATLDIEPGARSAALGSATMAIDGDYLGLMSNPYQLANVNYSWVSFSHTEYYEDTKYDYASAAIPLGEGQGLGISFSRFGADDIPYIKEGEPIPEGSNYNTLSIADWVFSATFGKRLTDRLELGIGFHGLYREIDQTGWGFRGDAGLRYRVVDELYLSTLLKGWTSSAATWESGEFEYSSPELYVAASYGLPVSYLYGKLNLYWQGAELLHREARDMDFETDEDRGERIWENPVDWLSGGRGGLEFAFDFGLSLRAGLSSFTTFKSVTAGAGLTIAKFLKIDYAFESHPVLSSVHRVSVSVSPYLFAYAPKPGTAEARTRKEVLLTEEVAPEESYAEMEQVVDNSVVDPAPVQVEEKSEQTVVDEPAPEPEPSRGGVIVETDDEILE